MTAPNFSEKLLSILTVEELCDELPAFADEWDLDRNPGGLTPADVLQIFKVCEAGWMHSGNPAHPHAELTSGLCSNGFFDVLRVLRYTRLCEALASILAGKITAAMYELQPDLDDDWPPLRTLCVGSDHAGAAFSHAVARYFSCMHEFPEKRVTMLEGKKVTHQDWVRSPVEPDQQVLQVEELMTTAGTFGAVRAGLRANTPGVRFMPVAGVLIHRSNVWEVEDTRIVAVAHFDVQTWDPKDCPLCAQGSERVRPKQNWAKLTGKA
jgi:orotate phosphoribosyltransferase